MANVWSGDSTFDDYRKILEQYFGDMDKQMERLFKDMQENQKRFLPPGFSDNFFKRDIFGESTSCSWIDKGKKKVLPLDFGPVPNSPLEVDVKNNQIFIKGKVKKEEKTPFGQSLSINSFNLSCPVPKDLKKDSIKVELVDNKYQIEMNKNTVKENAQEKIKDKKIELPPQEGDISI